MHTTELKTDKELVQLPEGTLAELLGGEIFMVPAVIPEHQRVSAELHFSLMEYVRKKKQRNRVGFSDRRISRRTQRRSTRSDLYCKGAKCYHPRKKNRRRARLVAEIFSEGNAYHDLKTKKKLYEKHGVREYWIVDPMERSVEIYQNGTSGFTFLVSADSGTVESKILDGFSLEVQSLFTKPF